MTAVEMTQTVAHEVVSMATKTFVRNQITENTDHDSDAIRVWVVSFVAGEIVASATDKVTKPVIEKAAGRINTWRENRKNQKEEVSPEGGAA